VLLELDLAAALYGRACRVAEVFDWVDANSKIVYEPIYGAAGPAAVASRPAADPPQAAVQRLRDALRRAGRSAVAGKSGGESGSLRVATEKVDALINLVGELVITQSMLGDLPKNTRRRTSNHCAEALPNSRATRANCRKAFCRFACCHRLLIQPLSALGA